MLPASVDELRTFCNVPNQRFVCLEVDEPGLRQTFAIIHQLGPPASVAHLEELEDNLVTEQLLDFYRHHDGATLFLDVTSDRAGLHLLPIGSWKRLQSVVIELYGEFREEFGLEWLDHFVAFGEVPHSGNYFVMPTHGTSAGNVIYCDHEGPTFLDWAPDFHTFLRLFLDSPCEQIYQLGSFLRFDEHGSDRQWIPERFFAGENFRRE